MERSRFWPRIVALARRARRDRREYEPPADPDGRAMQYLLEGFGPAVSVYLEARTSDEPPRFLRAEHALLEGAMNEWLELYARCYGVDLDARFTVREAAEVLVRTHDVRDVAQLLTHVPARREPGDPAPS